MTKKVKTIRGTENRTEVLKRLGLNTTAPKAKYFFIGGVPHKVNAEGQLVPMKKVTV